MSIVCIPVQRGVETTQADVSVPVGPARPAAAAGRRRPPSALDRRWLEWAAVLVTDPTGTGVALCLI